MFVSVGSLFCVGTALAARVQLCRSLAAVCGALAALLLSVVRSNTPPLQCLCVVCTWARGVAALNAVRVGVARRWQNACAVATGHLLMVS